MTALNRAESLEMLALLEEVKRRQDRKDLSKWFPDDGALARHLYPKHNAFFKAGAEHRERCFLAANRVGKSVAGGFETALHFTGQYPEWWEGWRIDRPPRGYCAGTTYETVREIIQLILFGPEDDFGSGMIPKRLIGEVRHRPNTNKTLDWANVKHEPTGRWGQMHFKAFEQGRKAFEGTAKDWVWGDEEMPLDIYTECLTRTATTGGRIILTFTPLEGITPVVHSFLEGAVRV